MNKNVIKILAVDDVESNRIALQYLINEYLEDIDLYLSASGEDALKITYKENIDIIILDIQMPGMDGFDTAKYLKSNPKTKDIPIIFLTAAFKKEEFQQKGFELGAIDYLTKPIEDLQLINKLELYIKIIIQNKQLQTVNEDLHNTLLKEIELKKNIENQQLELIQQSKMAAIGEMIGNIAHQWRQPLSIISTLSSGMEVKIEFGLDDKNVLSKNLNRITQTTEELSKMIDTFNNFTQQETFDEFNVNDILIKCIDNQKYIFQLNNINNILNLEENIVIKNLQNSLFQAILNILQNANEALENRDYKKYIFVTTTKEDDKIIINIKDNGGGISVDNINKIFEPYFTTKHKAYGIGLGLNLVYRIIHDAMKGQIKVRNKKYLYKEIEYEGAEFIITLPLS